MKSRKNPTYRRKHLRLQAGATLIEVLISLLIFSLGVLGLVGMQAKAVNYAVSSEDRSTASALANDLVAAMWAQQTNTASNPTTNPSNYSAWQTLVSSRLPGGSGTVSTCTTVNTTTCTTANTTTVTITWQPTNSSSSSTYYTQVVIQ